MITKSMPRYRALGNAMAVPVIRWILKRIAGIVDVLGEAVEERSVGAGERHAAGSPPASSTGGCALSSRAGVSGTTSFRLGASERTVATRDAHAMITKSMFQRGK